MRSGLSPQSWGGLQLRTDENGPHLDRARRGATRKDEGRATGTAVKLSIAPTLVPTGERSAWARPEIRLIYTLCLYNQAAVDQLMSPYLQAMGATRTAHFLGARTEWWF